METLCLPAGAEALSQAAKLLREGRVVAFPTETVYGLGANALDENAVRAIFAAKERPADNPLIVHVADRSQLQGLCQVTEAAEKLMDAFWPGPLTLLLKKTEKIPFVTSPWRCAAPAIRWRWNCCGSAACPSPPPRPIVPAGPAPPLPCMFMRICGGASP